MLIADLLALPTSLSKAARFNILGGYFYLVSGALLLFWPEAVQTLFRERDFVGDEASLIRVIGMALAVVGWLYLFGSRSGARQVVAASVVDRLSLVPFTLVPLALMGVFPKLLLSVGLIDPALGLVAWMLMRRET